jgi:hypothetical protein
LSTFSTFRQVQRVAQPRTWFSSTQPIRRARACRRRRQAPPDQRCPIRRGCTILSAWRRSSAACWNTSDARSQQCWTTARPSSFCTGLAPGGDHDRDSDIDVAVIVEGLTRGLKERIFDAVADVELEHDRPVSLFVFSRLDFDTLLKRERRIALDIRPEGIPL